MKIKVKFTRRVFGNEESSMSIYAAKPLTSTVKLNDYGNITISGQFHIEDSEMGRTFTVELEEDHGAKYPCSYRLMGIVYEQPKSARQQWAFLEEGKLLDIRALYSMQDVFSMDDKIIDIILEEPERLAKVKYLGETGINKLTIKLKEDMGKILISNTYKDIKGLGPTLIKSLSKFRGGAEMAIKAIERDPFSIIKLPGVGFIIADRFREFYDIPLHDERRCLFGYQYFMGEHFRQTGDTFVTTNAMVNEAADKLGVHPGHLESLLSVDNKQLEKYGIYINKMISTTRELFRAETKIATRASTLKAVKENIVPEKQWAKIKSEYLEEHGYTLSKEQDEFLDKINTERILLLLGQGGTGKSWVTKIACDLIHIAKRSYTLNAPTAKAAKVMSEYTGNGAATVHRGLGFSGVFNPSEDEIRIPYNFIIIDEFSMVDSVMAAYILHVMRTDGRVLIIGDDFQLPSVSPGNVLFDLINHRDITRVELVKVFRQTEGSKILDYATDLRQGSFYLDPSQSKVEYDDITFVNMSSPEEQGQYALGLHKSYLDTVGIEEVMLLTPINDGPSGRKTFNRRTQELLNPGRQNEMIFGEKLEKEEQRYYRSGDYIGIKKNFYDAETISGDLIDLVNGDTGVITESSAQSITIDIDGNLYELDKAQVSDYVDHAWSITIHKSQGSQADYVIIVIPERARMMINANLLYTAITRAKVKCIIVANFNTLNSRAKVLANFKRNTILSIM